jgi:hypothetical protein
MGLGCAFGYNFIWEHQECGVLKCFQSGHSILIWKSGVWVDYDTLYLNESLKYTCKALLSSRDESIRESISP